MESRLRKIAASIIRAHPGKTPEELCDLMLQEIGKDEKAKMELLDRSFDPVMRDVARRGGRE